MYIRAVGFFYHLSITVLFTTFTELLLVFFQNHVGKVAAFLGYVYIYIHYIYTHT